MMPLYFFSEISKLCQKCKKFFFEILVQTALVMGEFWRNLKKKPKSALLYCSSYHKPLKRHLTHAFPVPLHVFPNWLDHQFFSRTFFSFEIINTNITKYFLNTVKKNGENKWWVDYRSKHYETPWLCQQSTRIVHLIFQPWCDVLCRRDGDALQIH